MLGGPGDDGSLAVDRRSVREREHWKLLLSADPFELGAFAGRADAERAPLAEDDGFVFDSRLVERLLELPDHVVLYPSHYAGSVCGRGLSGNPVSSIGFERAHNPLLAVTDTDEFAAALLAEMPPQPAGQERIVAANRAGSVGAVA